jgi:hypothetical protein
MHVSRLPASPSVGPPRRALASLERVVPPGVELVFLLFQINSETSVQSHG